MFPGIFKKEKSTAEKLLDKIKEERPEYNSFTCAIFGHKCEHIDLHEQLGIFICKRCNHIDCFTETYKFNIINFDEIII